MEKTDLPRSLAKRQIVGFSLPPELATDVKLEAARRGVSLRKLFEEVWREYRANHPEQNS